jgi:outer membrane receptor protein involved in Fe transport
LIAAVSAATPAHALPDRRLNLHVPSQRTEDALLDLALQARVSLGGDVASCRGRSMALNGVMTLDAALTRVLAGTGCGYSISGTGAVIVRRAPPVRPPAPPRPAPAPVEAPPPVAAGSIELGDVIVTAERRPDSPQRAPIPITSVSGDQIAVTGAVDTNDLSTLVAGMTVTNLGSGRNKILLRGMSDGAFTGLTQSTVGLYLNLVPITYSAPDPDLKLIDIDRVEVLRGPQGVLYGAGPIGGVVRIVTRRPDTVGTSLDVSATRSVTRDGGPNTDYSGVINLPFPGNWGGVRAVAYEESFGGYINDLSLGLRRVNAGTRRGGRLTTSARFGEDWTLNLGVVRQSIDTEDSHYVYRTLGGLTRANLVREPHENDFKQAYVSLNGEGSWGRFDASIAYIDHRFHSRYDASVALPAFGSNGRVGALDENKAIDLWVGEFTFASRPSGRLRWLAGSFFLTSETGADTVLATLRPFSAAAYLERRDDALVEAAIFGEVSYDLTPDLTLTGGGRIYMIDYATRSRVAQGGAERLFDGDRRDYDFSPKVGLEYRANEDLNLYALISQGHRSGGFNTAGPINQTLFDTAGSPTREYQADTLWNYEVGAKATLLNGQLQTRVAAFLAQWQDSQSDQFLPSGLAYAVNVGDGANLGLEVETNWKPFEELEIRANTLVADPQITRPNANFNSRGDAGLPGVPAVSANVNVVWRRAVGGGLNAFADGNLAYVGASHLTFDAERRYRMGDYVTGRVSAGLETDHWTVLAFVENLFDSSGNTFSFGDPFRLPEALATTPLRPRTVGVTLKLGI